MSTVVRPFAGTFELDPIHSSVQFAVPHIVSTFRASFADVAGRLAVDESRIALTAIARVESLSIVDPPEFVSTSSTVRTSSRQPCIPS